MTRITIIALVAGLALASTAQATPKQHRQIVALKRQVAALQVKNAGLNQQLADLQAGSNWLQNMLTAAEQERDAAQNERDYFKGIVYNTPTEVDRAVAAVRDEAAYTKMISDSNGHNYPLEYLQSLAAMNYVVGHVTAPEYGYRKQMAGLPIPWNVELALTYQAGICGNAADVYAAIVRQLGIQVRSVQFYYGASDNHIADETFYAGSWHYFDPTWGLTFDNGASITDARSEQNPTIQQDETLLWHLTAPVSLADVSVLTAPSTRVDLGVAF
jgi:hypothetical protein